MEDSIKLTSVLKKEDIKCCICLDSLTGHIYQCSKGPHYACKECNSKLQKTECPICKHKGPLIRSIYLENQLSEHLVSCPNNPCPHKLFSWDPPHECKYAPVKCIVCKRTVEGNVTSYIEHLKNLCDQKFTSIKVSSFNKRLRYSFQKNYFSVIELLNNHAIIMIPGIASSGKYFICVVKNPTEQLYSNIICTYKHNGIEHNIKIPVSELNNIKIADVTFSETDEHVFTFDKEKIPEQSQQSTTPNSFNTYFPGTSASAQEDPSARSARILLNTLFPTNTSNYSNYINNYDNYINPINNTRNLQPADLIRLFESLNSNR